MRDQKTFLDKLTATYVTSESSQDRLIKTLSFETFEPFINKNGSALELGCLDGFMTSLIVKRLPQLTVVDGSQSFIAKAKKQVNEEVSFVCSLFEDFETDTKFDFIFACFVMEHVNDPVAFLNRTRSLLNEEGHLFIVVPNARALSRQLARHMGIIKDLYELTENDRNHGHQRVYDRNLLNLDIGKAKLSQISQGGILLKILADFQMDKLLDQEILGSSQCEGLYKLGLEYPDLAGSLFSVCKAYS